MWVIMSTRRFKLDRMLLQNTNFCNRSCIIMEVMKPSNRFACVFLIKNYILKPQFEAYVYYAKQTLPVVKLHFYKVNLILMHITE